jgi:hypothetical protein
MKRCIEEERRLTEQRKSITECIGNFVQISRE